MIRLFNMWLCQTRGWATACEIARQYGGNEAKAENYSEAMSLAERRPDGGKRSLLRRSRGVVGCFACLAAFVYLGQLIRDSAVPQWVAWLVLLVWLAMVIAAIVGLSLCVLRGVRQRRRAVERV